MDSFQNEEGFHPENLSPLSQDNIQSLWAKILSQIKSNHPVKIYPYLKEGQLVTVDTEEIVIGFPKIYSFHRSRLEDVSIRQEIERAIEQVTGQKIAISLVTISGGGVGKEMDGQFLRKSEPVLKLPDIPEGASTKKLSHSDDVKSMPTLEISPNKDKTSDSYDKKLLKDKFSVNERVKTILEAFDGKIVDVKKH